MHGLNYNPQSSIQGVEILHAVIFMGDCLLNEVALITGVAGQNGVNLADFC